MTDNFDGPIPVAERPTQTLERVAGNTPFSSRPRANMFLVNEELRFKGLEQLDEPWGDSERHAQQRPLAEQAGRFEAERLRHEMHLAARVQRRLLPATAPEYEGFEIFADSQAAEDTGGDYFDLFSFGKRELRVAIGDVCGHGIASALTMATLHAYIRAFSMEDAGLGEVLRSTNRAMALDLEEGSFATVLLAELDSFECSLRYAGAGHLPGYVLSASGELKAVLASQGPPLGMLPDYEFAQCRQPLATGDVVLIVTDGIIEAADSSGELFGIDRALELVRRHISRPAREICEELYAAARRFACCDALEDDATGIVIRAKPVCSFDGRC